MYQFTSTIIMNESGVMRLKRKNCETHIELSSADGSNSGSYPHHKEEIFNSANFTYYVTIFI